MIYIIVGFALIIIGWSEQVYRAFFKKHRSFSPFFLALYIVGAASVAVGSFQENDIVIGILSIITILPAFMILVNVLVKRKNPEVF